jgi:ABC-2 type transport system ATP-binding protein
MNIPVAVNQRSKCFNTQTVVHPLSFQVAKGEILGFLGPNGAGKSTTMKMIAGYLKPSQGTVCMRGYDLDKYPQQAKIRYFPEHNPLYLEMYVRTFDSWAASVVYGTSIV